MSGFLTEPELSRDAVSGGLLAEGEVAHAVSRLKTAPRATLMILCLSSVLFMPEISRASGFRPWRGLGILQCRSRGDSESLVRGSIEARPRGLPKEIGLELNQAAARGVSDSLGPADHVHLREDTLNV